METNASIEHILLSRLYLPLIALLIGYLLQLRHKKQTIEVALVCEINLLLDDLETTRNYLVSKNHYWLKEGENITTAPLDTSPPSRFYQSITSELHLLSKKSVTKVLLFHYEYEKTQNLKNNLFKRIKEYSDKGEILNESAVKRLRLERNRVVNNIDIIRSSISSPLRRIGGLTTSYNVESTSEIAEKLNNISSTT